jgi:hypothetical protein
MYVKLKVKSILNWNCPPCVGVPLKRPPGESVRPGGNADPEVGAKL